MKKIMFNDKYGLTDAVLQGRKTMTRRLVGNRMTEDDIKAYIKGYTELANKCAQYKIGDVVAVAQAYKNIEEYNPESYEDVMLDQGTICEASHPYSHLMKSGGWDNKMFVRADLMPHQIRITDIKVERLQDISKKDCFKEGIIPITWRQYLKQDIGDLTPQKYIDHNVYTLEKFREGIEDCWAESDPNEYMAEEAEVAFAVLIFKTLGRKVWDANPWVFAYSFKLVK